VPLIMVEKQKAKDPDNFLRTSLAFASESKARLLSVFWFSLWIILAG